MEGFDLHQVLASAANKPSPSDFGYRVDLGLLFPNLDREEDPAALTVNSKQVSWHRLFPRLFPQTPFHVEKIYRALYTGGIDDASSESDTSGEGPVSRSDSSTSTLSGSSRGTVASRGSSTTSGEFHPAVGDRYKASGLTWYTHKPSGDCAGVLNSCNIDGFITNLAIQFSRQKYDFQSLLKQTSGKSKQVEDFIRSLAKTNLLHTETKSISLCRDIKNQWISISNIGQRDQPGNVINLLGNEDENVFDHFTTVSAFHTDLKCKCPIPNRTQYTSINVCTAREMSLALKGQIRGSDGLLMKACRTCKKRPVVESFWFPQTTWMLHFMVDNGAGRKLDHNTMPNNIRLGGVNWFKSYASYWTSLGRGLPGHTVSLHFIKGKAFYYDDEKNKGVLYHFDSGKPSNSAYLQHIVYIRMP
jgi:hypothetical protein